MAAAEARARWAAWCAAASEGGGPADADVLLHRLLGLPAQGEPHEREAALAALGTAPPRLLLRLDRAARRGGAPQAAGGDVLGLLLRSFGPDGHVREAAVTALADRGGPAVAAGLALRSADWVEPVRSRAAAALLARSAPEEVAAAVRVLLRLAGRRRTGPLLTDYRGQLSRPAYRRALRALAADEDGPARRFGLALVLEVGDYACGDLLSTALHDHDQECRTLCAQRLLDLDAGQAARLLQARDAAVRELAVSALPLDVPATRLVGPLADRARRVRATARWMLYGRGEPPSAVYRRQIARAGRTTPARHLAGLAAGLGECGDAGDVPVLMRLLDRRRPAPAAVRRAAVHAVGRLAPRADLVSLLGPLARDSDPAVVREVSAAFAARGALFQPAPATPSDRF